MCGRLFKIISKHRVKCQFGSTPGVRCQDSTLKIKTLLHLRHNHNLPTWVELTDLVKAFDTFNHALLISILGKCGAPPRLLLFYNQFWHSQADFDEWHEGQVVPVPKKGDTSDPNKWRGVTLMDIINNIYRSVLIVNVPSWHHYLEESSTHDTSVDIVDDVH